MCRTTKSGQSCLLIPQLREEVQKALNPRRYEHTLGVCYTAAALAMRYGVDMDKAQIAGLLHDCAKNLTNEKRVEICEKHNIPINEAENRDPFLLHAKVGAFLARTKYHISDPDILDAIACHNTGRPDMTLLDKIIYIADYIEPGRWQAPHLSQIRYLAFVDLEACLKQILMDTLNYLNASHSIIDPATQETFEFYQSASTQPERGE